MTDMTPSSRILPPPAADITLRDRLQEYAALSGLPRHYKQLSNDCWRILAPRIPEVLSKFYGFAIASGFIADVDAATKRHIIGKQQAHWKELFQADFSDHYLESIRAIGVAHRAIGLAPSDYISGYAFIMSRIVHHVGEEYRGDAAHALEITRTVNSLVAIDMSLALSAYGEDVVLL